MSIWRPLEAESRDEIKEISKCRREQDTTVDEGCGRGGLFDSECCSFYGRGATAGKGRFILSFRGLVSSEATLYSDPFLLKCVLSRSRTFDQGPPKPL